MTKYDVWYTVGDKYCATIEADSIEHLYDLIFENPESSFLGRTPLGIVVDIEDYKEVK
jgi:hypothetical protein